MFFLRCTQTRNTLIQNSISRTSDHQSAQARTRNPRGCNGSHTHECKTGLPNSCQQTTRLVDGCLRKTAASSVRDLDSVSLERLWGTPEAVRGTCLASSWQKQGLPIFAQCTHPRSSGEFCRYHTTDKKRALGIWDPPGHNSLPQQKRSDALAEIPKRLRKNAGSAAGGGAAVRSRQVDVASVPMGEIDDDRMLLAMGISEGRGDGGASESSTRKRLRSVQDA